MKLAVISDTHDHQNNILKAVSIMNERKADLLIHCGDYCSPFTRKWFNNLNQPIKENFYGVFGNNDGDHVFLKKNLGDICKFAENGHELIKDFDGKKIFASHMPKKETIEALASSGNFNIILSGHTHSIVNEKYSNEVLIVNPGELCGYLTGQGSFALIDTQKLETEIIYL
ncbi:MAG: metallophosphoesterase [Candidatus Hodarchaeota archaeon]